MDQQAHRLDYVGHVFTGLQMWPAITQSFDVYAVPLLSPSLPPLQTVAQVVTYVLYVHGCVT